MKKLFSLIFTILIISFIGVFLLRSQIYRVSFPKSLNAPYEKELSGLAVESLKSDDVPVAAIIVYNYQVIGKGYNTVIRETNVGGHAEINAISDAIKNIGFPEFSRLSRDSLILISTFEPCPMCKGAIEEYKIKQVQFVKSKTITHWLERELGDFIYEIHKKQVDARNLQDSLFELHPGYKKK